MTNNRAPSVSVVMPVFNGERYLAEAIESILGQTFTDFEFIIIDDCSQDGSAEIICDYAKRDERIRVVQHERNRGPASARNSGIAASRGQFIAAMDCDDISLPKRLEKQVDFLRTNPDIGMVGTWLQTKSENTTWSKIEKYEQEHARIVLHWILGRTTVGGATFMARRSSLTAVGGYEESVRTVDDKGLFTRLYGKTRFANLPEALYLYRLHDQQTSATLRAVQKAEILEVRRRWLSSLLDKEARAAISRLDRLYQDRKFSWWEWWLLWRDVKRLINATAAANIFAAADMPWVEAEMSRRLESAMPRRWQMFLHWRRHRFGTGKNEETVYSD